MASLKSVMKFPRLVTNYILENVTMVDVEIRGRNRDEKGNCFSPSEEFHSTK